MKIFADKNFEVIGVDLSKKMIEVARKKVKNAKFHVMNIRKLDFNHNSFDGIWASASFIHIPKLVNYFELSVLYILCS